MGFFCANSFNTQKSNMKQTHPKAIYLTIISLLTSPFMSAQNQNSNVDSIHSYIKGEIRKATNTIQNYTINQSTSNDLLIDSLEQKVIAKGNKLNDLKVLKTTKDLHSKSKELVIWISDLKDDIIIKTGGIDSTNNLPIGSKNSDVTSLLLVGNSNDGKAYELKLKLDSYIDFLNKTALPLSDTTNTLTPLKFPMLALDEMEDPLFANEPDLKTKDFAHLTFEDTPMIAAMAFLTEKQAKVIAYETQLLERVIEYFNKIE